MVALWWAIGAAVVLLGAELLHLRRIGRVAPLAFGPDLRPRSWTAAAAPLRAIAAGAAVWGLLTLIYDVEPRVHAGGGSSDDDPRHMVLVLDVSPSMRLVDAGPDGEQSRLHRARDVLNSMFGRVSIGNFRISIVATYNGALPVVVDTSDAEVVRAVLGDLPMHFAFRTGETRLFDGLEEAAKIAADWKPQSTTLVVISDGDTLPPKGMPKMPASITGALVIGVGDPVEGSFINGRNSRQDVSALRQMALRLGGTYHDGNQKHVATSVLSSVTEGGEEAPIVELGLREYALLAIGLGTLLLALIPVLLHLFGTGFRPGASAVDAPRRRTSQDSARGSSTGRGEIPPVRGRRSDDRMTVHRG